MKSSNESPIVHSARERTLRVVNSVKKAMGDIANEIAENDGIYPHNHGRLSMAEVCRRSGVHEITMMGPAHRDTTRPMIFDWIKQTAFVKGRVKVRNAITKRSDEANEKYRRIASQYQAMYQVEMPKRDAEIVRLQRRIVELEAEILQLQGEALRGQVVRLPVGGRKRK